ncbi:hypothetical protein [Flavobacterium chilense]|uniref:Uncharacterized protein n=1 Tax=Flavobacterium chilense TaxID=946677 RepID=A0A1M7D2N6_9FLAO|nr:hypothetical protein [Flavobacterium chilense]SHL73756.1 hypothetical protein SAMN05444484_102402 [Flavobacterium chilense]
MNFKEYQKDINDNYPKILDENLLFWALWNVNYAYDIFEKFEKETPDYSKKIKPIWFFLWSCIENKHVHKVELEKVYSNFYPIDEEEIGLLNDFYLPHGAIKQIIIYLDFIYQGLSNNIRFGSNFGEITIQIMDVIIENESLGYFDDNINTPLVKNELEAQTKLIETLTKSQNFTFKDRSIYRDLSQLHYYLNKVE